MGPSMHLTLLESDRSFFRSAEFAFASIVAHLGVIWFAVSATDGGLHIPANEREARVFFLLPPDRVNVQPHQTEVFRLGKLGADLADGKDLTLPGDEGMLAGRALPDRRRGKTGGARGNLPFGAAASLTSDTVFSVLEVDRTVERYDGSAAPVYPAELIARGTEGAVQATYVVDTLGRVDTTTISVVQSDDPRFTESVKTALGQMLFRPAKRSGRTVRQLVQQRFRFRIAPSAQAGRSSS
jgi:TonB family protein